MYGLRGGMGLYVHAGMGLYVAGKGHTHWGPGTSFVQRIDWNQTDENRMQGFGCVGTCGRSCAPDMTNRGFGCAGNCANCVTRGLGLFDSGLDFSGWGWPECGIAVFGGYMVLSTIFTTGRAVRKVRAIPGERRKRKAAKLRARASELTKKK